MRLASVAWVMVVFALSLMGARSASAGTIVGCSDPSLCTVAITVNGAVAGEGTFLVDSNTGDIYFPSYLGVSSPEIDPVTQLPVWSAYVANVGGNQDPFLTFGVGASNNGAVPVTFGFAFSLPISFPDPMIQARASVSYSLTDGAGDGATLFPTSGTGFVVDSQDIRITPFLSYDKRVDVGPACVVTVPGGGAATCGPYNAGPVNWSVPAGGPFNIMSVAVGFGLTPRDSAGLSGVVRQDPIPEPGTVGLLGLGVAGLALLRRRLNS
jgi:hypothetical protein